MTYRFDSIDAALTGKRILAVGVFDLFHIGHLRYLQYARQQGAHLSVAVTPDAIGLAVKAKRPVIPEEQRIEIIRGLGWVDAVRLLPASTEQTQAAVEWIADWNIHHVVAGGGWSGSPRWARLIPALAERGVSVDFAPHTEGISTTEIVVSIRQGIDESRGEK